MVPDNALFVTISQSGETADTLAALEYAKNRGFFVSMAICNVLESFLVRLSDLVLMTRVGPEIGVASTKAFTTQLAALFILTLSLARHHNPNAEIEAVETAQLKHLLAIVEQGLELDSTIKIFAEGFVEKQHTLFLARGTIYLIALEGALKLKEVSYIHAEGYPAGSLSMAH